jgi:hypothetical protein
LPRLVEQMDGGQRKDHRGFKIWMMKKKLFILSFRFKIDKLTKIVT